MVTPTEGELKGQSIVSLIIQCAVSWQVEAKTVATHAASICALVDALENSGDTRVELTTYQGTSAGRGDNTDSLSALITIKSAHDSLDLARVAGALNPSVFRRLFFAEIEAHEAKGWADIVSDGYGNATQAKRIEAHLPLQSLVIPQPDNCKDRTPAESFKALAEWAAKHGLTITTTTA
jgi:hypothetical protein